MDKKLLKDLFNLRVGSKVEINGRVWAVKERVHHEKPNEWEPAITRYELDDDYVLEFSDETPHFFQLITKNGWFGSTTTTSKVERIKSIKIVRNVDSKVKYPFIPKSTKNLLPGMFWEIPLSNGKYACGRVIELKYQNGKLMLKSFLAGLLDWVGSNVPTIESIAGCKTLEQGSVHIKTITSNKGKIRGYRLLELDSIEPQFFISQAFRPESYLMKGMKTLRPAKKHEWYKYPVYSSWGYEVIKIMAEQYFVEKTKKRR